MANLTAGQAQGHGMAHNEHFRTTPTPSMWTRSQQVARYDGWHKP